MRKAESHGIAIRRGEGTGAFEEFLQRHARFLAERRFETSITVEFARAMQDLLPRDQKLEALLAEKDGEIVGSLLLAKYGNSWEYLASNLNERGRRLHAGRRLIWEAICLAKRENFERFDVGGFDPEASTGIQQFKRGLHPTPYRLAGEFEAMPRGLLSRLVRWRAQRRHG